MRAVSSALEISSKIVREHADNPRRAADELADRLNNALIQLRQDERNTYQQQFCNTLAGVYQLIVKEGALKAYCAGSRNYRDATAETTEDL